MTLGNDGTSLILVVPDGEAMAKTTDERSDLTDLVDYPRETLDIELKDWIDLGDKVAQAKLARHIAALANHGGAAISSSAFAMTKASRLTGRRTCQDVAGIHSAGSSPDI